MSLGRIALGLCGIALGVSQIRKGAAHIASVQSAPKRLPGRRAPAGRSGSRELGRVQTPSGSLRLRTYQIKNLDGRIRKLRELVEQGMRDPTVYEFARRAVNKKCGSGWCAPEKDTAREIKALFDAVRQNVRYTSDIRGVDSYQQPGKTLALHTGDCLPGDTKLLLADGALVCIEDVKVGEVIFDGAGWAKVTNWWDKGVQDVRAVGLNNGCTLRCTDGHKLFRVPRDGHKAGDFQSAQEVEAGDLKLGDDLLQPRELAFADAVELSPEEAFLLGAYVAEGGRKTFLADGTLSRVSIAGIPNSKGIRELAIIAAQKLGFRVAEASREIYLSDSEGRINALFGGCGSPAVNKRLPHVRWAPATAEYILQGLNADGGLATNGKNFVFSTTSPLLAVQYRILQRILGRSSAITRVDNHQGLGTNPIYRVTVRTGDRSRPWAKVRSVSEGGEEHVFDIETDSHRFYLPEQDIVVHNCDDYSTLACALAASIGIPCRFKVIKTRGSDDWNHIFAQMGLPRSSPTRWVAFDASVAKPCGWEAPPNMVADSRVFRVV